MTNCPEAGDCVIQPTLQISSCNCRVFKAMIPQEENNNATQFQVSQFASASTSAPATLLPTALYPARMALFLVFWDDLPRHLAEALGASGQPPQNLSHLPNLSVKLFHIHDLETKWQVRFKEVSQCISDPSGILELSVILGNKCFLPRERTNLSSFSQLQLSHFQIVTDQIPQVLMNGSGLPLYPGKPGCWLPYPVHASAKPWKAIILTSTRWPTVVHPDLIRC